MLNADSDATDEAGTTRISLAIRDRIGYSRELLLHQARTSKWPLRGMVGLAKYVSSSEGSPLVEVALRLMWMS